jgi:hypothetical protein
MYLNSNQKKALIYMSTAGALLIGANQGLFKLNYPFLKYSLQKVDNRLRYLAQFLSNKEKKQIARMIKESETDNNSDEFVNVLMCYVVLDWCLDKAFGSKKYKQIASVLKECKSRLMGYLKKLNYPKEQIIEILCDFYFNVEL